MIIPIIIPAGAFEGAPLWAALFPLAAALWVLWEDRKPFELAA